MTLKLIHFPPARSLRVVWAAYELGLDLEIETRAFAPPKLKDAEYLAKNPVGKTPVLFDDEKRIIESIAIIEYLANRHAGGKLTRAVDDADYADYLQWMQFGEAGLGGYLGQLVGHAYMLPENQRVPAMLAWAQNELRNGLAFIEGELGDRDYILGEFSLADISLGYPLFVIKLLRQGDLLPPRVAAYLDRLTARQAFQRASSLAP